MTFSLIRTGLSDRIIEINDMLNFIDEQTIEFQSSRLSNSIKGIISILLYGCIEYVVSNGIKKMEQYIASQNMQLNDYNPILISRFLNAQFDSVSSVGRELKWDARFDFCKKIADNIIVDYKLCQDQRIPTDGKNIRKAQLESICKIYGLNINEIIPDRSFTGRLDDIVNQRCFIAHGNCIAYEVGRNFTPREMRTRLELVNHFCTNFIEILQNYIDSEAYKR